jgi:hypothetical protein
MLAENSPTRVPSRSPHSPNTPDAMAPSFPCAVVRDVDSITSRPKGDGTKMCRCVKCHITSPHWGKAAPARERGRAGIVGPGPLRSSLCSDRPLPEGRGDIGPHLLLSEWRAATRGGVGPSTSPHRASTSPRRGRSQVQQIFDAARIPGKVCQSGKLKTPIERKRELAAVATP